MKNQSADSGNEKKGSHNQGQGRGERSGRRSEPRRPLSDLTVEDLRRYFIPCSCCGHFLARYRIVLGRAAVEDAGRSTSEGWVPFAWNITTRNLLRDIYGLRTDIDSFHLEAMCGECQRRIVFTKETQSEPELSNETDPGPPEDEDKAASPVYFRMSLP